MLCVCLIGTTNMSFVKIYLLKWLNNSLKRDQYNKVQVKMLI